MDLLSSTLRMLCADTVQKAKSGHPGMPLGTADITSVLWSDYLSFNPEEPDWINRDRFVLSAGHGSSLLYSLLHLFGYKVTLEDLQNFRQWDYKTAGHPEYGSLPGIECTTGPLGQGIAMACGMALAEKMAQARFNTEDFKIIDHNIFAIAGDGCLMEGVSAEACSLAGHLKLDNLILLYDSNNITIEGNTNVAFSDDTAKRYEAYGWKVYNADGHNKEEIKKVI
ncbi:transketolase, partial [bacterium]|nr:transketolase [bacterium]